MESKLTYLRRIIGLLIILFTIASCKNDNGEEASNLGSKPISERVKVPKFNADSAYYFIEKQLSFGPRVPGTEASQKCADWMVEKLKGYGAKVVLQDFEVDFLDQKNVPATNIIASFNPKKQRRVLLCAHWDSRAIADKDDDRKNEAIPGADDGASGTAALIEIARVLAQNPIDLGIDIVLFDAEDQGEMGPGNDSSWALGSQYFSLNPPRSNFKAEFGILLDMIAAKGARFGKEGYSMQYARKMTDKIWKLAQAMGNGHLFQNVNVGPITDDHYWINTGLQIPTVDIINIPGTGNGSFGAYHHTHEDDIDIIDKRNLKSVGQVVLAVIYRTSDNSLL
jgi:hypothetical protein